MTSHGVKNDIKQKIIGILLVLFPGAKIYLYGSRARGTHQETSDIDLAVDTGSKDLNIGEARAILEASHIPYKIDVVNLQKTSPEFKAIIQKEGILWNQ